LDGAFRRRGEGIVSTIEVDFQRGGVTRREAHNVRFVGINMHTNLREFVYKLCDSGCEGLDIVIIRIRDHKEP